MLPTKFQVNWLFSQEKNCKIVFQDSGHDGHLGFLIRTILALFYLQVTLMLPSQFGVSRPFGSGEKAKNYFSRWQPWQPSWISNQNDFSYFDLLVTPMLPIKLQRPWQPSWISDQNDLSYFCSTRHPNASYQVSSQLGFWSEEKKQNIDFKDSSHGGHHEFPIGKSLAIFDLQFTLMLSTKIQVNWPISSGEEAKKDFQDGSHCSHLRFLIGMILAIFDLQVTPILHTKFQVSWLFSSGEEAKNRFSRWRPLQPSRISDRNDFSYF